MTLSNSRTLFSPAGGLSAEDNVFLNFILILQLLQHEFIGEKRWLISIFHSCYLRYYMKLLASRGGAFIVVRLYCLSVEPFQFSTLYLVVTSYLL